MAIIYGHMNAAHGTAGKPPSATPNDGRRSEVKLSILFAIALLVSACTDTDRAGLSALGRPGHITCWTGTGGVILDTDSTGIIQTVDKSDGWEFEDAQTHKFIRVSGTCLIRN